VRANVGGVAQGLARCRTITATFRREPSADRFFTDARFTGPGRRSIKGICLQVDQEKDNYNARGTRVTNVVFSDPNGKEIAKGRTSVQRLRFVQRQFHRPRNG
jgi:hypothetical protein